MSGVDIADLRPGASAVFAVVDAGSDADAARATGDVVYWKVDNGVTLTNTVEGDIVFERDA